MKKKTILMLFIGALCFTPLFSVGQQEKKSVNPEAVISETAEGTSKPEWLVENTDDHITVIDNGGHQVVIKKPIERVLASGMAVFPAIRALQAEQMVIGAHGIDVQEGEVLFPYMSKLPLFALDSGTTSFDYEKVVLMDPDLFIVLSFNRDQIAEGLASTGIPVVQLDFGSNKDVLILGALLGKEKKAEEYVSWIEEKTRGIEDKIKNLTLEERPRVFLFYGGAYGMSPPPPYGSYGESNVLGNNMIKKAGGRSITAENPGEWITVDPEWVIEQAPDVLIREFYNITGASDPELGYRASSNLKAKTMMNKIVMQPAFESSNAVKEKNVHIIFGNILSESWVLGLPYMAKWLHPEIFEDLDPNAVYQEFITRFMRVDYNIYEQGLFSYSLE